MLPKDALDQEEVRIRKMEQRVHGRPKDRIYGHLR
ncbi:hypothetical protein SBA7_300056 [Candidatus Sulfotelmatobacter sp. SbA7]|nr:hypothetical protein SBA7_300056 [Candidatus Sulfotelmatobacter sp. SbA7]